MPKYRVPLIIGNNTYSRVFDAANEEEAITKAKEAGRLLKEKDLARGFRGASPDDVLAGTQYSRDQALETAAYIRHSGLDVYRPETRNQLFSRFEGDAKRNPYLREMNTTQLRGLFDFTASRLPAMRTADDITLEKRAAARVSAMRAQQDLVESLEKADKFFEKGAGWKTAHKATLYGTAKFLRDTDAFGVWQRSGIASHIEDLGRYVDGDEDLARKSGTVASYSGQALTALLGFGTLSTSLRASNALKMAQTIAQMRGGISTLRAIRSGARLTSAQRGALRALLGTDEAIDNAISLIRATAGDSVRHTIPSIMAAIISRAPRLGGLTAPLKGAARASMGLASTVSAMRDGAEQLILSDNTMDNSTWWGWAENTLVHSLGRGQANRYIENASMSDDPETREMFVNKAAALMSKMSKKVVTEVSPAQQEIDDMIAGKEVENPIRAIANWIISIGLGNIDSTLNGIATMPATYGLGGLSGMALERIARGAVGAVQSFTQEYRAAVVEVLSDIAQEHGDDINNTDTLLKLLSDPNIMAEADRRAKIKGVVVGISDGIGAGLVSLNPDLDGFVDAARKAGAGHAMAAMMRAIRRHTAKEFGKQAILQPAIAGAGEAASQALAYDEINWRDVAEEAIGELLGGTPEIISELRNFSVNVSEAQDRLKAATDARTQSRREKYPRPQQWEWVAHVPGTSPSTGGDQASIEDQPQVIQDNATTTDQGADVPVTSLSNFDLSRRVSNGDKDAANEWALRVDRGLNANQNMTLEEALKAKALINLSIASGQVSPDDAAMAMATLDAIIKVRRRVAMPPKKYEGPTPENVTITDVNAARETIKTLSSGIVNTLSSQQAVDTDVVNAVSGALEQAGYHPGIPVTSSQKRFVYELDMYNKTDALENGDDTDVALGRDRNSGMPIRGVKTLQLPGNVTVYKTDAGQYVVQSRNNRGDITNRTYATSREALHAGMAIAPTANPAFLSQIVTPTTVEMSGSSDPVAIAAHAENMYKERARLQDDIDAANNEIALMAARGKDMTSKDAQNAIAERDALVERARKLSADIDRFTRSVPNVPDDTTQRNRVDVTKEVFDALFGTKEDRDINRILEDAKKLVDETADQQDDPNAAITRLNAEIKSLAELQEKISSGRVNRAVLLGMRPGELAAMRERIGSQITALREKALTIQRNAAEAKRVADEAQKTARNTAVSNARAARKNAHAALRNLRTAVNDVRTGAAAPAAEVEARNTFNSAMEVFDNAIDDLAAHDEDMVKELRAARREMQDAAPQSADTSRLVYGAAGPEAVDAFNAAFQQAMGVVADAVVNRDKQTTPGAIRKAAADVNRAIRDARAVLKNGRAYAGKEMRAAVNAAELTLDAYQKANAQRPVASPTVPVASGIVKQSDITDDSVANGVSAANQDNANQQTTPPPTQETPPDSNTQEETQPDEQEATPIETDAPKTPDDIPVAQNTPEDPKAPRPEGLRSPTASELKASILSFLREHPLVRNANGVLQIDTTGLIGVKKTAATVAKHNGLIQRLNTLVSEISSMMSQLHMLGETQPDAVMGLIMDAMSTIEHLDNVNWDIVGYLQDSALRKMITRNTPKQERARINLAIEAGIQRRAQDRDAHEAARNEEMNSSKNAALREVRTAEYALVKELADIVETVQASETMTEEQRDALLRRAIDAYTTYRRIATDAYGRAYAASLLAGNHELPSNTSADARKRAEAVVSLVRSVEIAEPTDNQQPDNQQPENQQDNNQETDNTEEKKPRRKKKADDSVDDDAVSREEAKQKRNAKKYTYEALAALLDSVEDGKSLPARTERTWINAIGEALYAEYLDRYNRESTAKFLMASYGVSEEFAAGITNALPTEWTGESTALIGSLYNALGGNLQEAIAICRFAMAHSITDSNCTISNMFVKSPVRRIMAKVAAFFGRNKPFGDSKTVITTENNSVESLIRYNPEAKTWNVIVHEIGHVVFNLTTDPSSPTYDAYAAAALFTEWRNARASGRTNIDNIAEWFATECDRCLSEGSEGSTLPNAVARMYASMGLVSDTVASAHEQGASNGMRNVTRDELRAAMAKENDANIYWEGDADDADVESVELFFEKHHRDRANGTEGYTPYRRIEKTTLRGQIMAAVQALSMASPRGNKFQVTLFKYAPQERMEDEDGHAATQHRFLPNTDRKVGTTNMTDVEANLSAIGTLLNRRYGIGDAAGTILVQAMLYDNQASQAYLFDQMRAQGFNIAPIQRFIADYRRAMENTNPARLASDHNGTTLDSQGSGAWLTESMWGRMYRFAYNSYAMVLGHTARMTHWRNLSTNLDITNDPTNPARLALLADGGYVQRAQELYLNEFEELKREGREICGEPETGSIAMEYLRTRLAYEFLQNNEGRTHFHNFPREQWEQAYVNFNQQYPELFEWSERFKEWWGRYLISEEGAFWGDSVREMADEFYVPMSRTIEDYTGGGQASLQNDPTRRMTARPGDSYAPVDAIIEQRVIKNVRRNMVGRVIESMADILRDPDARNDEVPGGFSIHDYCHLLDESFVTEQNLPRLRALLDAIADARNPEQLNIIGEMLPIHDSIDRVDEGPAVAGLRAELDKHKIVMAFREGRPILIQFTDNILYNSIRDTEGEFSCLIADTMSKMMRSRGGKVMRWSAAWIRFMFVYDAAFQVWNTLRDAVSAYAMVPTSRALLPILTTVRGIAALRNQDNRRLFYGSGAGGSSYYTSQSEMRRKWRNQPLGGVSRAIFHWVNSFADAMAPYTETGTRAGIFFSALEDSRRAHPNWTEQQHIDYAAGEARGLCDFAAHGMETRGVTTMTAFLRGQINGTLRSIQALTTRERAARAWSVVAYIAAAKAIEMLTIGDDDEYWRISKARRSSMLHVKLGETYVPIPLPQTLGVVGCAIPQFIFDMMRGENPLSAENLKELGAAFSMNMLPNVIQVYMALKYNQSSIGTAIVPSYLEDLSPTAQWSEETSKWAKTLSRKLSRAMDVQISPIELEYISRNVVFPGAAQYAVNTLEVFANKMDWSALKKTPLAMRVTSKTGFKTDAVRRWQEAWMQVSMDYKSVEAEYERMAKMFERGQEDVPSMDELAKDKGYNSYVELEMQHKALESAAGDIQDAVDVYYGFPAKPIMDDAAAKADLAATMALRSAGLSTSGSATEMKRLIDRARNAKQDVERLMKGGK